MGKLKQKFSDVYPRPLFGFKRVIGLRQIKEGYVIPFGWGIAYTDYVYMQYYIYPIPFNWIIWIVREIYFRLNHTPLGIENKIWKAGYDAAYREMYRYINKWIK